MLHYRRDRIQNVLQKHKKIQKLLKKAKKRSKLDDKKGRCNRLVMGSLSRTRAALSRSTVVVAEPGRRA